MNEKQLKIFLKYQLVILTGLLNRSIYIDSVDEIIEKLGEPVQKYQPNDESTAIWNINQKYSCTVHFNANNIATEISMNYNLD